jgi:hypothetical protein
LSLEDDPDVGLLLAMNDAQRNYRFFFLFIATSTFLCLYVFALSWLHIAVQRGSHDGSLLRSMTGEPLSLVLIVYAFAAAWFVGGLTVFHVYLMSTIQVPTATTISPACFTSHRQTDRLRMFSCFATDHVRTRTSGTGTTRRRTRTARACWPTRLQSVRRESSSGSERQRSRSFSGRCTHGAAFKHAMELNSSSVGFSVGLIFTGTSN